MLGFYRDFRVKVQRNGMCEIAQAFEMVALTGKSPIAQALHHIRFPLLTDDCD